MLCVVARDRVAHTLYLVLRLNADMLNYDKIQAQKLILETEQVRVRSLLESMMEEYHLPATNKNISFESKICSGRYEGGDEEQGEGQIVEDVPHCCFLGDAARLKLVSTLVSAPLSRLLLCSSVSS